MQSHGDPCLTSYWLRNAATWRDQVDDLLVLVNRQRDRRYIDKLREQTEAIGGTFRHIPQHMIHGEATRELVADTEAEAVMLIEDDAFIRRPEAVRAAFDRIEEDLCDVIATPRGGYSEEIRLACTERFGPEEQFVSPEGNTGFGLWPCFVFAKTETLRATSQRYESWSWHEGEVIPGLNLELPGAHTDSFTCTAIELRAAGARIWPGEQWKEMWNRKPPEAINPGWFHAGGLSNGDFLKYENFGNVHDCGGDPVGSNNEGNDWAHRLWWWRRAYLTSGDMLIGEDEERYGTNLDRLIGELNVAPEVEAWGETAPWWITWNDQA